MTSPFIPSSFSYGDAPQGGVVMPMIIAARNPSNTVDKNYASGYFWLSDLSQGGSGNFYVQSGNTLGSPNWSLLTEFPIKVTVASPTASATVNSRVISATFTGFTTAAAATQAFTIVSNFITATSAVNVTVSNLNASGNNAQMTLVGVTQSAGQIIINTKNNGVGALGAGDNVIINVNVVG